MADRDITVVTPATSQDLISLAECKLFLNISAIDTSRDAQLQQQISIASAVLADMANRKPELGFGETTVIETWREVGNGRLFLMHWPVKQPGGIIDVTANGNVLVPADYRLESYSGKLSLSGGGSWPEPAVVHYTGGFVLPEKAPLPLKRACAAMVQEERIRNQQSQTAGIRQLSHKEARVAFFDPNSVLLKTVGAKSPGMQTAEALIRPYIRIEV